MHDGKLLKRRRVTVARWERALLLPALRDTRRDRAEDRAGGGAPRAQSRARGPAGSSRPPRTGLSEAPGPLQGEPSLQATFWGHHFHGGLPSEAGSLSAVNLAPSTGPTKGAGE